jgi:hypothetical protein
VSDRRCSAPSNDIRRNAYFAGVRHIEKLAKGEDVFRAVCEEFTEQERKEQAVAMSRIRGRENPNGGFDPPRCDGELHVYEVLSVGRWYKSAGQCPIWLRERRAVKAGAKPVAAGYFED